MKSNAMAVFGGTHTARLVLFGSGLVAVAIAVTILFAPAAFYAGYGIEVIGNATLVNELKAPAGALLVAGLVMFAGVFRCELAVVSLTTAAVVYLSYGLSRVTSIAIDGVPHSGMVNAAGLELAIGAICLLTLLRVRQINAN
jgi:hypothetical protein